MAGIASPDTAATIQDVARAGMAIAMAAQPAPATTLARGAQVGRFVVLDRLGQGGMGIVYAAYDPELDRKLALKLIRDAVGDGDDGARDRSERLAREAKAMARLAHPNVVTVYDVGRHGDQLYVAMALVDGSTLRQWNAVAKPDWRAIVDVMRGAAKGLAAAHDAGIVHRDFKPDNVLVDASGHARVADFGLARELRPAGTTTVLDQLASITSGTETAEGTVIGTPTYMAPELLAGGTANPASDQFAFFVTLYELLFGVRPFAGRDLGELAAAMTTQRFHTAPSRSEPAPVPRWLRRMVMRGLAADPEARWPSMAAVVAMLSRDRVRAWTLGLGLGACVAASVATGLSVGQDSPCDGGTTRFAEVWGDEQRAAVRRAFGATAVPWADGAAVRTSVALDDYGAAWIAAHRDACEATEVHREQSSELLDLRMACLQRGRDGVDALVRTWSAADADIVASADTAIATLPPIATCADPQQLRTGGVVPSELDRERIASAESHLARARVAITALHFDTAAAELAEAAVSLDGLHSTATFAAVQLETGRLANARGDLRGAAPRLQQAVASAEAGAHDRVRLSALLELGAFEAGSLMSHRAGRDRLASINALWQRLGAPETDAYAIANLEQVVLRGEGKLEEALGRSRDAYLLALESSPEAAPAARGRVAALLMELGRYPDAEREATTALDDAEARFGTEHPTTANARFVLAAVYGKQKKWAEAEPLLERALTDLRTSFGDDHLRVADAMLLLGNAVRHRAQNDRALELYRAAFTIREAALGENHPKLAVSANTLGVHLMDQGKLAEAVPLFDRALAIRRAVYGERHAQVAMVLDNRALAVGELGRTDEAEADLREALEIREAELGPDHPDTAHTREGLGNRLRRQGRLAEAEVELTRALAANEKSLPPTADAIVTGIVNLGILQLDLEHWDEATTLCRRALDLRESKLGDAHPNLVYPLDCLGNAALGRGDPTTAAPLFERALALLVQSPDRHALWGEASYGLARALAKKDPARARTLTADALRHYRERGTGRATMIAEIERFASTLPR